jgi:hypothetical protein
VWGTWRGKLWVLQQDFNGDGIYENQAIIYGMDSWDTSGALPVLTLTANVYWSASSCQACAYAVLTHMAT